MLRKIQKVLSLTKLRRLQYRTGVFGAAKLDAGTGYNKAWIRDNVYMALGLKKARDVLGAKRALWAMLDMLKKHEYKLDWAIKQKPDAAYKYVHARFDPLTYDEFQEHWGNKQNDAVGGFLFLLGELASDGLVRDSSDLRVIQKLVDYLASIEYWHDPDNGVWENDEEVHASSIGACVAGLRSISGTADVPAWLIKNGNDALNRLLPRESASRETDLALLSLIYPYRVVTNEQREQILRDVEQKLVRKRGVVRYFGDWYYNNGKEAEWVMGFPWLAIVYREAGNRRKYWQYMLKTMSCMNWKGDLPELYYADTDRYNENTPLGWNHALLLCAVA